MHAAALDSSPRLQRVHALLSSGQAYSTLEIVQQARVCAVNSIIAELRANGETIACRRTVSLAGERIWIYQMEPAKSIPKTIGVSNVARR